MQVRTREFEEAGFVFDPDDIEGMKKLMEEYGGRSKMYHGKNVKGEDITISIFNDGITTLTYQKDGWIRRDIFMSNSDGDLNRETMLVGKVYEGDV